VNGRTDQRKNTMGKKIGVLDFGYLGCAPKSVFVISKLAFFTLIFMIIGWIAIQKNHADPLKSF